MVLALCRRSLGRTIFVRLHTWHLDIVWLCRRALEIRGFFLGLLMGYYHSTGME